MTFNFTPTDNPQSKLTVPYFEDARANFAPYYNIEDRPLDKVQDEIRAELAKLGGINSEFQEGYFGTTVKRYGFLLKFQVGANRAQMQVAGLPMRKETPAKIKKVRLQALLILRDWLKSAVTSRVFAPGSNVLLQFLLVDGKNTVGDTLMGNWKLPNANPALLSDVVDGEMVE
jgi:hypothetical protein